MEGNVILAEKKQAYGNDSISSLKGADRVRKRPGVIFGSDGLEGCQHAVFEILSNSIDEAREGHGSVITVTAANVDCAKAQQVTVDIANCDVKKVTARILTGEMHDMNTFEDKEKVHIVDFTDFTVTEEGVVLNLPACSVVEVTING